MAHLGALQGRPKKQDWKMDRTKRRFTSQEGPDSAAAHVRGPWLASPLLSTLLAFGPQKMDGAATVRKNSPFALLLCNTNLRFKTQVDASDRLNPGQVLSPR